MTAIASAAVAVGASRHRELRHRRNRRAVISLGALAVVLTVGTLGFHAVAGTGPVESFYFESMLATGQGPPLFLNGATAQLFASAMAFLSVGTVVTTLVLNLGPIFARLWREGVELAEREVRKLEGELEEDIRGAKRKG
ncbi:MAG: hypothetical protein WBG19_06005 [Thermoplasmata archaeon]